MKFIYNIPMIRPHSLLLLLAFLSFSFALLPLQRQQHQGKYEIGTINSLNFLKDKIFFRSDDDLFGFLDQKDGQLLTVYQLELGQKIVRFTQGVEVVIARQKKLNMFWPYQGQYVRSYETRFLQKHPEFNSIIDYQKSIKGGLILTDKYLMQVPPASRGTKLQDLKEKILVELTDPTEALFGLIHLYNFQEKKIDDILVSLIQNDKVKQVCFRKMEESIVRHCLDLLNTDTVEDVVASGHFVYVQLSSGAIVIDQKLTILERLDSKPTQYFQGMVTIGQNNQFYVPMMKTKFDLLLIQHSGNSLESFMGMKVEDTLLSFKIMTRNTNSTDFETVSSIAKKAEQTPRKVWSFAGDKEGLIRVYVQFQEGKLVCYSLDLSKKTIQELWQFTTIKAEKVATGELQAEDIEQAEQAEDIEQKQESQSKLPEKLQKKLSQKEVNQSAEITQKIAP